VSERTTTASVGAPGTAAPRTTTAVQWFVGLSVAMYFLQRTVITAADLQQAFGVDAQAVGRHWWSIVTYPFVHASFATLALNLYLLWLFAPRLESRWGTREFVRFIFVCGVGGWAAHLLLVSAGTLMVGSTAIVLGVLLAYATLWPTEELLVFGAWPVSTRWFVLGVALLTATAGALFEDGGSASFAHLGGFMAARLYLRAVASVDLERLRQGVSPVAEVAEDEMPRAVPKSMPRSHERPRSQDARSPSIDEVVAQSNAVPVHRAPPSRARRMPRAAPVEETPTLDTILDKISASGIDSLSSDERAILDAASRRLREP
jgi:membrane associated rhomboid family serine protease